MFCLLQIHMLTYRNIYRNVNIQVSIQTNIFLTDESSGNNTSVAMAIMPIYSFHYSSPIKGTSTPWRNRVWPEKCKICRMCLSTCGTGNWGHTKKINTHTIMEYAEVTQEPNKRAPSGQRQRNLKNILNKLIVDYNPKCKINIILYQYWHKLSNKWEWIDKSPGETNLDNLCRYSNFKKVKNNSLSVVHTWWLPSKSTVYRVGNINNLTVKKPDKYYFTQVIKVNIWIDKSYWWYAQLILEQHRLELFGYTYTQIYFSINTTILHDLGWVESRDAKQWIWRADSAPWEPTDFGICSRSWN